jgi:hypothetical protein
VLLFQQSRAARNDLDEAVPRVVGVGRRDRVRDARPEVSGLVERQSFVSAASALVAVE